MTRIRTYVMEIKHNLARTTHDPALEALVGKHLYMIDGDLEDLSSFLRELDNTG